MGGATKKNGGEPVSDSSGTSLRPGPFAFIRNPQDFWGGLGLVLVAAVAWWASRNLPGQTGFAFGPGTAPRLFIMLLAINGAAIAIGGLLVPGPKVERWNLRAVLFILGAVLVFAAAIRPLGLVFSTFAIVVVSSAADPETKWGQTFIWAALLSAFCAFLFPYVLNLPMQLFPRF